MKSLSRLSFAESALIATALLAAQNSVIAHVDKVKAFVGSNVFNTIVSAGAFALLFKGVIYLYEHHLWKLRFRGEVLEGKWRHKIFRHDVDNDTRAGEFEVVQDLFDVRLVNGIHRGGKSATPSLWHSIGCFRDPTSDTTIWFAYEVRRNRDNLVGGESDVDVGLLRLNVIRDPSGRIVQMAGQYMDAGKSQRRGRFEAGRIPAEHARRSGSTRAGA
jgi:hypothetical protein